MTGIRGLCNGLGPALFGLIFYIFNVNLNEEDLKVTPTPLTSFIPNQTVEEVHKRTNRIVSAHLRW